jgi:transcriptional regulator with XRE-family HTH domain
MPPARKKPPLGPELAALGEAVERLRKERGLTQEQLGLADHNDHKLAGEVERGQRNLRYLTLVRLAGALGTTPGEITSLADRIQRESYDSA